MSYSARAHGKRIAKVGIVLQMWKALNGDKSVGDDMNFYGPLVRAAFKWLSRL